MTLHCKNKKATKLFSLDLFVICSPFFKQNKPHLEQFISAGISATQNRTVSNDLNHLKLTETVLIVGCYV